MKEKYNALSALLALTPAEVDEYMNTFDLQWGEKTHDINTIHNYVNSSKDYKNNVPIKPSNLDGSNTAIVYKILNMMCSLGNVKKMYIPSAIDENLSLKENQLLVERQVANELDVGENKVVLDIGCGMGLVADHMSDITKAKVHGLNVESSGIKSAQELAIKKGREETLFKEWDYNKYPWPYEDNSFDGIYEIQAFTFMQDPDTFFKEMYRILKPGGCIVINETVLMDDFDADNEEHWKLMQKSRPCGVGGNFWYYKYWEDIIKKAGFNLTKSIQNKSALSMIKRENSLFEYIEKSLKMANNIGIIPKHICTLVRRFRTGGEAMIRLEEISGYCNK